MFIGTFAYFLIKYIYNKMITFLNLVENFLSKYGFFIVGGALGALIRRMRKKMSISRFLKFLTTAVIVALASGIIARDWFNIQETVTYVICGIFGAFSEDILNEVEEFIHSLSDIAKKKAGLELDKDMKKDIESITEEEFKENV